MRAGAQAKASKDKEYWPAGLAKKGHFHLIGGRPLPIGRYELHFAIGDHFRSRGILGGDPPFLDVVPLRFSIAEPEGHYHVPLLCTPWSYSTYRGS